MGKKKQSVGNKIKKYVMLFIGAALAAIALEVFLVPNNIIDGGITGVSIILSYLTDLPLGGFIFLLNVPFLMVGYKQIGKGFVYSTLFSITILAIGVSVLHPVPSFTQDILLASIFGGIILGIGVGIVIRYGGSLDGTEIVAIVAGKRSAFSVGEIIMFFNLFILGSAGFVFTWDKSMYSLIAYFIAFRVIDLTIEGLDESKAAIIISDQADKISECIMVRLGRGVTYLEGRGGYTSESKGVLYVVVTRLEIAKLKGIIDEIDENAFVTINDVHEVLGGRFRKKAIH